MKNNLFVYNFDRDLRPYFMKLPTSVSQCKVSKALADSRWLYNCLCVRESR